MTKVILHLKNRALEAISLGQPLSEVRNVTLIDEVVKMKYTIPNDDLSGIDMLHRKIDEYYLSLH